MNKQKTKNSAGRNEGKDHPKQSIQEDMLWPQQAYCDLWGEGA